MKTKKILNFGIIPLLTIVCILSGCKKSNSLNSQNQNDDFNILSQEISELNQRIKKLEEVKVPSTSSSNESKFIKSITFRRGTKDARLRIYWSVGERTDLPCTKEQSIWACG